MEEEIDDQQPIIVENDRLVNMNVLVFPEENEIPAQRVARTKQ